MRTFEQFINSMSKFSNDEYLFEAIRLGYKICMESQYTGNTIKLNRYGKNTLHAMDDPDCRHIMEVANNTLHNRNIKWIGINGNLSDTDVKLCSINQLVHNGLNSDEWADAIRKAAQDSLDKNFDIGSVNDVEPGKPVDTDTYCAIVAGATTDDVYLFAHDLCLIDLTAFDHDGTLARQLLAATDMKQLLLTCALVSPSAILSYWQCDADQLGENTDASMMQYSNIATNQWLIHFTSQESAESIFEHGFDRGNKLGSLAYNYDDCADDFDDETDSKYSGNYLFAFPLMKLTGDEYVCYGNAAVVFKSSAMFIRHLGDSKVIKDEQEGDLQCIFDKDIPNAFFMMKQDKSGKWLAIGANGRILIKTDSEKRCIQWLAKNADTYQHMMNRISK